MNHTLGRYPPPRDDLFVDIVTTLVLLMLMAVFAWPFPSWNVEAWSLSAWSPLPR